MPEGPEEKGASILVTLNATGPAFVSGGGLDATVDLLQGYGQAFIWCLERAARAPKDIAPRLKISKIEPGSISVHLLTEVGAALAPLWPQLFRQGWDLYKAGYDIIQILSRHMREKGEPMSISVIDSPGTMIAIVNGSHARISRDVYENAVTHKGLFARLAGLVKDGRADSVKVDALIENPPQTIEYNHLNAADFDVPTVKVAEDDPVEFACSITRFNKRTLKGALEYTGFDGETVAPFTIGPELYWQCVAAFSSDTLKVRATRTMEVNALGETRIREFRLTAILTSAEESGE
jgi:hypothetical protein